MNMLKYTSSNESSIEVALSRIPQKLDDNLILNIISQSQFDEADFFDADAS